MSSDAATLSFKGLVIPDIAGLGPPRRGAFEGTPYRARAGKQGPRRRPGTGPARPPAARQWLEHVCPRG